MIQDKAQSAGNGMALFKDCNAVLDHLGSSRRASREAIARRVVPLDKDRAIACEARLAINGFTTRCMRQYQFVRLLV